MKYNLGCGTDYRYGWVNVDRAPDAAPDVVWDLATFPWPFADDSADEVALFHLLDEMPMGSETLPRVMRELYRICRDGAVVTVRNTDPRHADAALKPMGSGGLAPNAFQSYDLAAVEAWLAAGSRNTPSALHARVDFAVRGSTTLLDARWREALQGGGLVDGALAEALLGQNNVAACAETVMEARKPFAPGRSLREADALVLARRGGLGDVLMVLSACRAIKSVVDRPIYLLTDDVFCEFASLCPFVDFVASDQWDIQGHAAAAGRRNLKFVDLSPVRFGLSRLHEVDAFLAALNVTADDADKGLVIDVPEAFTNRSVAAQLARLPAGAKRVVLHPGVSDPNRTFSGAFWSEIAAYCLLQGHAVVVVGQNGGPDGKGAAALAEGRVLDLTDKLDLASSLQVLRSCDLFISADSGPIQLAGAADIAIMGLYTTVGGEKRLPYRNGSIAHRAVAVGPDCPFSPCYRWMSDPGSVSDFVGMMGIAETEVTELFAKWCVTPDRYACTREATFADRVKALIPAMVARLGLPEEPTRRLTA